MAKRRSHFKTSHPAVRTQAFPVGQKWWYVGGAVLAAILLLGNRGFRTVVNNTLLLRRLKRELVSQTEMEQRLEKNLVAIETDDAALERAARRELGYLKPGEVEYRFPPPKKK